MQNNKRLIKTDTLFPDTFFLEKTDFFHDTFFLILFFRLPLFRHSDRRKMDRLEIIQLLLLTSALAPNKFMFSQVCSTNPLKTL